MGVGERTEPRRRESLNIGGGVNSVGLGLGIEGLRKR